MREAVLEPATFRLQKGATPTALYERRANFTTSTPDRRRARAQELQHTAWVRTRWTSELRSQRPALQPDSARAAAGNAGGVTQPAGHHSASRRAAALLAAAGPGRTRLPRRAGHGTPRGAAGKLGEARCAHQAAPPPHVGGERQRRRPTWAASAKYQPKIDSARRSAWFGPWLPRHENTHQGLGGAGAQNCTPSARRCSPTSHEQRLEALEETLRSPSISRRAEVLQRPRGTAGG